MHTKIEGPRTAELQNDFKSTPDVLFILISIGFPNDKLAISDDRKMTTGALITDSRRSLLQS